MKSKIQGTKLANSLTLGDPFWMVPMSDLIAEEERLVNKKNKTKRDREDLANIREKFKQHENQGEKFNCDHCQDTGIIEVNGDGNKFESGVIGTRTCPHCLDEPLPTQQDLN